jgi:hypothetical protein
MDTRKRNVRCAASVVLVSFYFLLNTTIAKADTVFNISVEATFAKGTTNQVINPTPNFSLTGDFTLDSATTSAAITSFDMVLTPVGSNAYALSSGTGSAQAYCFNCAGFGYWQFLFSDSNASIRLPTIYPGLPLAPGGTYYLGAGGTTYPDGRFVLPWCCYSASASFGGSTGYTYGEDLGDVLTSGFIHVNAAHAVPEPPAFIMLLVGVGILLGVRLLKRCLPGGWPIPGFLARVESFPRSSSGRFIKCVHSNERHLSLPSTSLP